MADTDDSLYVVRTVLPTGRVIFGDGAPVSKESAEAWAEFSRSAAFWATECARERRGERAPWRAIAKRVDVPLFALCGTGT